MTSSIESPPAVDVVVTSADTTINTTSQCSNDESDDSLINTKIIYRQATNDDLPKILSLQQLNLPKNISSDELKSQGFVTVEHDLNILSEMNHPYGHTVAIATKTKMQKIDGKEPDACEEMEGEDDDEVLIGYALTMTKEFRYHLPILIPMFDFIDKLSFAETDKKEDKHMRDDDRVKLGDLSYVVMGQVCVAKSYRGKGVFGGLYKEMKRRLAPHFVAIITEVATNNTRSLRAHSKVGFIELDRYYQPQQQHEDDEDESNEAAATTTPSTTADNDKQGTCWVVIGMRTTP